MATQVDNLPTRLSSFVGREREITELVGLLATRRLVTLVGAPGVGKTRLALRVAEEARGIDVDGAAFVELAGLAEPDLVPRVIASTLGIEEQGGRPILETLVGALRGRRLLVVLDNCEHLIDACATVVEALLGACPEPRLLATSREALRCEGEVTWRVPSLSTPSAPAAESDLSTSAPTPGDLLDFEAVRLFVDRSTAARPAFALTSQNAGSVATICRRLDGIPLALELAAARVTLLSPEQIAARLDDRFRLLTGGSRTALPRQQTLEATIDWSYRLLPEPEQTLLRRLAVFAGGWSIPAAEAICTTDTEPSSPDFLDLFSRLVDKSLVQVDPDVAGEPRYRLLEMIRQYSFERLVEAGEAATIRDRHRSWFLRLVEVEKAEPFLYWAPAVDWLDRLEADHDNLRAALDWSLVSPSFSPGSAGDPRQVHAPGLRLALALFWPWFNRGHYGELRRWLMALLGANSAVRTPLCARAELAAALLAIHQRDIASAMLHYESGLRLAREIGDAWAVAWATEVGSHFCRIRGELEEAASRMEEALQLFRAVGYRWGESWSLRDLGSIALYQGDYARAETLLVRSLEMSRAIGDDYCATLALNYLGQTAFGQQQLDRATAIFDEAMTLSEKLRYSRGISQANLHLGRIACAREQPVVATGRLLSSLERYRALGEPDGVAVCLDALAEVARVAGDCQRSASLVGAAAAIRMAGSIPRSPHDRASYQRLLDNLVAALGQEEFDRWHAAGAALSVDESVERCLELSHQIEAADARGQIPETAARATRQQPLGPLSPREREVAALVARGLTNRQIAEALVVSRRTVDAHVASILGKLNFSTRAQIAAWVAVYGVAGSLAGQKG